MDGKGVGVSIVEPGFIRDAGMFVNSKAKLPGIARTSSPEDVANGVVKAIRRDRAEVVVAPIELRASALLLSSLPEIAEVAQKATGAEKVSEGIAEGHRHNR